MLDVAEKADFDRGSEHFSADPPTWTRDLVIEGTLGDEVAEPLRHRVELSKSGSRSTLYSPLPSTLRSINVLQEKSDLVYVAPEPVLSRFERLDDRVAR
jgi:hypothetical protein